jgi:serine/threonine-protein kinase
VVKVLDFGISKDTGGDAAEEEMQLTRTTAVLGSPYYMAPEQMRSTRSVDARADIWSLGIILYQLLTKKVPFKADSFVELCLMVVNDEPAPPSSLRPDLPQGLEQAVLKAIRKRPEDRYVNVAELAAAIAPYGQASAITLAERVARVQGAPVPSIERPSSVSVPPPPQASTGSPASSVGSAVVSNGPTIPSAVQETHPSPTGMPAETGTSTSSTTKPSAAPDGQAGSATGAAWGGATGATPTVQARRTGAKIVVSGAVLGAAAVIGLFVGLRGKAEVALSPNVRAAAGDAAQVAGGASAAPQVGTAPSGDATAGPGKVAGTPAAANDADAGSAAPGSTLATTAGAASPVSPNAAGRTKPGQPPPSVTPGPVATVAPVVTQAPAAPPPPPPPAVTQAPAPPPPPPTPTVKKNVLDIDIK